MIFSILASALFAFFFISPCDALITENQIRILFNNGIAPPENMSCSERDMTLIMQSLLLTRRNLRQRKVDSKESLDIDDNAGSGRKLPSKFYPASCKTSCKGFATGTCVAAGCKGYRRELQETEKDELEQDDRDLLVDDLWCVTAKTKVETLLNVFSLALVSRPCRKLMKAPRRLECLTVVC